MLPYIQLYRNLHIRVGQCDSKLNYVTMIPFRCLFVDIVCDCGLFVHIVSAFQMLLTLFNLCVPTLFLRSLHIFLHATILLAVYSAHTVCAVFVRVKMCLLSKFCIFDYVNSSAKFRRLEVHTHKYLAQQIKYCQFSGKKSV